MKRTNSPISQQDLQIEKIPSPSTQAFGLLYRLPRLLVRFCLVHWKEIAVIFYGSLMMGIWLFVAYNKIINFEQHMEGMLRQPFSKPVAIFLAYAVPSCELIAALLIGYKPTRLLGLGFSALLMTAFTAYVGLAILHVWSDKLPCNCGLIIQIGWKKHFVFNVFLLLISSWAFVLQRWVSKSVVTTDVNNKTYRYSSIQSVPIWRNRSGNKQPVLKRNHGHKKE
ncbi:MAG: DoxX family protein [Sphingobacterium sp.]|jgi:hypothetical protein|nr:DoxX family protein [Sphingobacterium sp.]